MLLKNGALDVYTIPIMMKKNRPAVLLSCLCKERDRDNLVHLILTHTSTLGVRMSTYSRDILERSEVTLKTEYGNIRVKRAFGFGVEKIKPEYDDVLEAAQRHGIPFSVVRDAVSQIASLRE